MVILKGGDNDILSVRLKDILLYTKDTVNWNLLWIEGVSIKEFDMLNFQTEVNKSIDGHLISFPELIYEKNII